MRIPRLFIDSPFNEAESLTLQPTRAHYLINVLRLQADRPLLVFNGRGGEYEAKIESVTKKSVTILIERHLAVERESPLLLELAIGASKGERMDWILQKSTELGVTSITPLLTERSEVKLNAERWQKKIAHWREVIISACEQCGRNRLPTLLEPTPFANLPQTVDRQSN